MFGITLKSDRLCESTNLEVNLKIRVQTCFCLRPL